jgi:KipI family sensor histidine kinase inhibitor
MNELRVAPAGDAGLIVEFPPEIDPATSERVIALSRAIRRRCGPMLRDLVVGYCTLTVYFDPLRMDAAWLEEELRTAAAEPPSPADAMGAMVDIPVCYGGDLGPDLADVAAYAQCTDEEVVRMHSGATYRVYVVGFVPGFPYMAAVDPRIALPRRPSPRTKVPAGSVAIAAGQTGIYPSETPGGWHLIGRTPVKPYDPLRSEPFLLMPGDQVRFHAISRSEFDAWPSRATPA